MPGCTLGESRGCSVRGARPQPVLRPVLQCRSGRRVAGGTRERSTALSSRAAGSAPPRGHALSNKTQRRVRDVSLKFTFCPHEGGLQCVRVFKKVSRNELWWCRRNLCSRAVCLVRAAGTFERDKPGRSCTYPA